MRLQNRLCVPLAAALLASAPGPRAASAQADTAWSALYLADLERAHALIAANHPGVVDSANPAFARTLKSAYAQARRAAAEVDGYTAYRLSLTRFGNAFQDAHLNIGGARPMTGLREAGIYPVFRGGALVVEDADARYGAQTPALRGAALVECDGRPADRLLAERVLSWRGRKGVEADRHLLAPLVLVDYGLPLPAPPASCRFRAGGRTVSVPLRWAETTEGAVRARQVRLTSFEPRQLGVRRSEGGREIWVDVPTFGVDGEAEVAAMRAMLDSLDAELARNRDWRLLVFDLRGNDGGSSAWGDRIAGSLFGEEWIGQARAWLGDGVYTEWRVSPDNVESARGGARQAEQRHGAGSSARAFADSLEAALRRGAVLYGARGERRGVPRPPAVALPGHVVVVAGPSCFSACLDFLDRMRLHPAVVQVGEVTGVDTDYMENWGQRLPSGLSGIGYPMKVYRNRRRAADQAYAPHVWYGGPLRDTAALRAWIRENHARW